MLIITFEFSQFVLKLNYFRDVISENGIFKISLYYIGLSWRYWWPIRGPWTYLYLHHRLLYEKRYRNIFNGRLVCSLIEWKLISWFFFVEEDFIFQRIRFSERCRKKSSVEFLWAILSKSSNGLAWWLLLQGTSLLQIKAWRKHACP